METQTLTTTRFAPAAVSVTIRRPDTGFHSHPGALASARSLRPPRATGGIDSLSKLALMAANSAIWLYVAALAGLAA